MYQDALQRELFRVGIIVLAGVAAGWSVGYSLYGLLIGLAISQVISIRQASSIFKWSYRQGPAPQDSGLIGYSADRIIRREKTLKDRLLNQAKMLQRYNQGIEALKDGVVVLDSAGHITTFNSAATRMLYLRKDDSGQHLTHLIRVPQFVRYFRSNDFGEPLQFDLRNVSLQVQITEFGIDQKIMLVRDVTERKRVETMRQDFIADVSHELRTPLTVINGYLEMLSDMDTPAPLTKALNQMDSQANRMTNLVNDLIQLSKLESASRERDGMAFDLTALCHQVAGEMKGYSGDAVVSINTDRSLIIDGFKEEMHSALTNLVTNAIKYGDGKQVDIAIASNDRGIEVAVTDRGPGIPPEHLSRVTERFYRVDESRESTVGGSGLGLSIVKHALEHHDAELKIESTQGQGSTFSFVVPAFRRKTA
ncbi:two-component system, OmpR family, phosphate regulon sensor histidine kinase PhoR [Thalassolituus maritimus]|uniref:Phosphate regulon sensor protein PhoR n=1 Tax=Thalassolituus maritimus TaxID=484498 RepID=A0A1N7JI74_9GAMM|nr:phosphate regulon sensor histidine kinase PhoR [Thalassolituus maritimus]SIS48964.1 two-component system, OmpR family, phosphate regulon sensor histidine kinase PhoR [Thalassolituus maritimus]